MRKFRFSRKEYNSIIEDIQNGRFYSCSPAIERELLEVKRVGIKNYPWKDEQT